MAKIRDDFSVLRHRISVTILLAYAVSFLFFLGYAFFTFPEKLFLRPFRVRWTMIQTAVSFIGALNPVQCTALLLACSFSAPPVPSLKTNTQAAFSQLISSTLVVLIVFGSLYVVLAEGLLPRLNRSLMQLEDRTEIARNYLDLAVEARSAGELKSAEAYLSFYLHEDPGNSGAVAMLSDVRRRIGNSERTNARSPETKRNPSTELEPGELIDMAQESLDAEDFYTAYYYADLARQLSPAGSALRRTATTMANFIQDRLSSYQADAEELARKALFEMKSRAFSDLSSDDVELVSRAYYTFRMLAGNHPDDMEVKRYLEQSIVKLRRMAYFIDEVDQLITMPGALDLFFVNAREEGEYTEILSIGKVISSNDGTFAREIELVSFDADGSVRCHLYSEAGKIMEDGDGGLAIFLRGIDPVSSDGTRLPVYLEGSGAAECGDVISLRPSLEELNLVSRAGRALSSHHLPDLWGMWDEVAPFGYPTDVIQIEVLVRIISDFSILILPLFALAIGWRLRSPGRIPSIGAMIFIPVFPFIAYFVIETYEYLNRLISGSALVMWGFSVSLVILLAVQFVLLVASILALANQSLRIRES